MTTNPDLNDGELRAAITSLSISYDVLLDKIDRFRANKSKHLTQAEADYENVNSALSKCRASLDERMKAKAS